MADALKKAKLALNIEQSEIFTKHQAWALSIARLQALKAGLRPADRVISENAALTGLWQASARWRPVENVTFKTYARKRIQGEILDQARQADVVSRRRAREAAGVFIPTFSSLVSDTPAGACNADFKVCDTCETNDLVEVLLTKIRGIQRTVIVMHFFQNMSLTEISEKLGKSATKICAIKNAALAMLRTHTATLSGDIPEERKAAN